MLAEKEPVIVMMIHKEKIIGLHKQGLTTLQISQELRMNSARIQEVILNWYRNKNLQACKPQDGVAGHRERESSES